MNGVENILRSGEKMSKSQESILPIIWGALLLSQMLYLAIPNFLDINVESPEQMIVFVLCGVGVFNAIFAFVLPGVLKLEDRMSSSIIQYALFESCAVFGLVCTFLGAESIYQYGLAFLSAGGMLLVYPKRKIKGRL